MKASLQVFCSFPFPDIYIVCSELRTARFSPANFFVKSQCSFIKFLDKRFFLLFLNLVIFWLLEGEQETARSTSAQAPETEDLKWFYQGRNGWWEYDERTAQELELHHKKGDKNCELLIAGFLYSIDFENMLQCRRNEPNRYVAVC